MSTDTCVRASAVIFVSNRSILAIICLYLLGLPVISSLNGLSMHLTGISAIGPLYHTVFSLVLIAIGVGSRCVQKSAPAIFWAAVLVLTLVGVQCALGLSNFSLSDLGQLYKWLMPIGLLAVFYRWRYFAYPEAQELLARTFRIVPLLYSGLIFVSFLTYLTFGFNPTLFEEGTRVRFVGFAWGYNTTVNSFFICAFPTLFMQRTPPWVRLVCGLGFFLLLSKTAVVYFALLGFSFARPYLKTPSLTPQRLAGIVMACALLVGIVWFGFQETVRSADLYQEEPDRDSTTMGMVSDAVMATRLDWWQYVLEDAPSWPVTNLVFGNGLNIDRRVESPLWWRLIGSRYYTGLKVDKSTKTLELDMLGHFDLFGLLGASVFAALFYVYPLLKIKVPLFRPFYVFLILLSMTGGHLLNNPHATSLLVFFLLFLRNHSAAPSTRGDSGTGCGHEVSLAVA